MRPVFRLAVLILPFVLSSCKSKPVTRYWTAMDCNFDATLHGPGGPLPAEKALDLLEAESHRLDHLFSDYDATSPLSVLRGRKGDTVVVGREIALVLRKALVAMHLSGNAFDPGMHDLKALWGIGTEGGHVPPADSVNALLVRRFGFLPKPADTLPEPFAVLPDDRVVLLVDSLPIDLGGIAKGYSVDRLSAVLDSVGWPRHLIQGGGEIIAAGRKTSGSWHIGIKNPRRTDTIVGVIRCDSTGAVSTSGDYERYFLADGVRYHHIFDPPTGHPAQGGTVSVTVLCPTSLDCDAFTKPMFVMGPARSRHLADSLGLQAFWIRETPAGLCFRATTGWGDRLETSLPGCPADW
jgi:FAD:protein FMN transferase